MFVPYRCIKDNFTILHIPSCKERWAWSTIVGSSKLSNANAWRKSGSRSFHLWTFRLCDSLHLCRLPAPNLAVGVHSHSVWSQGHHQWNTRNGPGPEWWCCRCMVCIAVLCRHDSTLSRWTWSLCDLPGDWHMFSGHIALDECDNLLAFLWGVVDLTVELLQPSTCCASLPCLQVTLWLDCLCQGVKISPRGVETREHTRTLPQPTFCSCLKAASQNVNGHSFAAVAMWYNVPAVSVPVGPWD